MNVIFRCRDVVIRVASPSVHAACSIELAMTLARHGIPVVAPARPDVVEAAGLSATAWDFVASSGDAVDWSAVGSIVRRVHELSPSDLPASVPTPSPAAFPWWDFEALLDDVGVTLDSGARAGIDAALHRWNGLGEVGPCRRSRVPRRRPPRQRDHDSSRPVVIDWDLLCVAPPGWDHAPLMTWTERWGWRVGDLRVVRRRRRRVHRRQRLGSGLCRVAPRGGHPHAREGGNVRPGGTTRGRPAAGVLAWRCRCADLACAVVLGSSAFSLLR